MSDKTQRSVKAGTLDGRHLHIDCAAPLNRVSHICVNVPCCAERAAHCWLLTANH